MSSDPEELMGLTLREIAIKTYEKVQFIETQIPHFVTWAKLGGATTAIIGIAIGLYNVFN